jgi:mRNA-degrading endonuclease RelE of RelBE toxin-antitoxin system
MNTSLHKHAAEDLRRLRTKNPKAAAAVAVVLEQLRADPKTIDKLTTHGENAIGANLINVKQWQEAKRRTNPQKGDLWRLRILHTPATSFRVFYGYHWPAGQICVLAILHKDDANYDDLESDICKRILADWHAL